MITITFASIELSSLNTRRTVIDGGFPLDYDGHTYLFDGLVIELDNTTVSASLSNVTQNITLFLDDDVKAAIQTDTYRNRYATIYKGEWDPSTATLSDVKVIYKGLMDTHNAPEDNGTVEIIVSSLISPMRRPSDNLSLQVLHNQRLANGVYGASNLTTTDTFLRNAGESFEDFTLGANVYTEAKTKPMYIKVKKNMFGNHKMQYVGEELVRAEILESPGAQLETPGTFQPARVYGISGINPAIIAAWNHSPYADYRVTKQNYGEDWRGFTDSEAAVGIREDTRFATILYLVHAGEVDGLNLYFDGLSGEPQDRTASFSNGDTAIRYLNDEDGRPFAAVEVLWGANDQEVLDTWVATSNGAVDTDFRGIGYVIVGVTMEATRDGAIIASIPDIGFQVKQTKSVSFDIPVWTEIVQQTIALSYDSSSPYSAESFYLESANFGSTDPRILSTGTSFRSAFLGSFLTMKPGSVEAAEIDTIYGLDSNNLSVYNYVDGVSDFYVAQGTNYGLFKVTSVSRTLDGTSYTFWLSGIKGHSGNIDITQDFDVALEDLSRSGSISLLNTRVEDQHPARILVDYLVDRQVGPGISEENIDLASFLDAQENAAKIPQYLNGVLQGKDTFIDYIQDIADTANLTVYQEGDKIKCRYRRPIGPSDVAITFTEDNTSAMKLIGFRSDSKYNEFVLTVDLQKISDVKAPKLTSQTIEVRDSSYLSEDNGIRSIGEYQSDYLTLFYSEEAEEVVVDETESSEALSHYNAYARFLMDISRFYEEIEITTTYDLVKDFTIGTVFDVENDLYGFTGDNLRRYETLDYRDNHNGTVTLVGQLHTNAIFGLEDDFSNNVYDTIAPVVSTYTSLSTSAIPNAPSLSATWEPTSRRIDLSWTEPTLNAFNIVQYQLQEKANGETEWTTISEQLATSDRVFSRAVVERGGIYRYRIRALTTTEIPNGPFSDQENIRLDLAFGDNQPEQQEIIITGQRSNASVASTVDTTVTIGLPTNYESAPADVTGTGATSNIGGLVDLDVVTSFEASATDSDSGTLTAITTALPGSPSGGNYQIVDTFSALSTGTASQSTGTVATHNLTNGAGNVTITSDHQAGASGRFPTSGTSTSAVTSQALPNGAGEVTVSSNFVAGASGSDERFTEHYGSTNADGTFVSGSGESSPTSIGGFSGLDLVFASLTSTATTVTAVNPGVYSHFATDGTPIRFVSVAGGVEITQPRALSSTSRGDTGGAIDEVVTLAEGGTATVNYTIVVTGSGPFSITATINSVTLSAAAISAGYSKIGTGAFWEINNSDTYSAGPAGSTFLAGVLLNLNSSVPYSITAQTAGNSWSNTDATINATTGVISFASQTKNSYTLTNNSSVVINDVVLTVSSSSKSLSTFGIGESIFIDFPGSGSLKNWSVELAQQGGTFTLPESTGTLVISSDHITSSSIPSKPLSATLKLTASDVTTEQTFNDGSAKSAIITFYEGEIEIDGRIVDILTVPSSVPANFAGPSDTASEGKLVDGNTYAFTIIKGLTSDTSDYSVSFEVVTVVDGKLAVRARYGYVFDNSTWSGTWQSSLTNSTRSAVDTMLKAATDIEVSIGKEGTYSQPGRSDTVVSESYVAIPDNAVATASFFVTSENTTFGPQDLILTIDGTDYTVGTAKVSSSQTANNFWAFNAVEVTLYPGVSQKSISFNNTFSPSGSSYSSGGSGYWQSVSTTLSVKVKGAVGLYTTTGGAVDTSAGYSGSTLDYTDYDGHGSMPSVSRSSSGITSYTLTRSSGVTLGVGLIVDYISQNDSYAAGAAPIKDWSVAINAANSGSTSYSLTRNVSFTTGEGLVIDGVTRGNSFTESAAIGEWYAFAERVATGTTTYTFNPDSQFTDNRVLTVGGITRISPYNESDTPRNWSATATKPASGSTVYTLSRASNFTGGQGWTIDGVAYNDDIVTIVDNVKPWSIAVSRPQSGGTTYSLASGPSNLGVDLTVGGQVLTAVSPSYTFSDSDTNRAWSAVFEPTTFSLEVDPNDVVYVGNSFEIVNQAITKGADEDDALTEIANAIIAMHADITWDTTITTNGSTGNREVLIDFGTTSNIGFDISLGGKNTKNGSITDIETLGAGVNFSAYTLTSPDGGSTLNFNGFTSDATVADRNNVITEAIRQVDVNAESPKDFFATSDGNSIILTARSTGVSAGTWNFAWNHGSSTGNLRAKTYSTDTDSQASSGNINANVLREGVVEGSVNNDVYPTGTYTTTYVDAIREERNFFAERSVVWTEGSSEPAVSTTTTDYTWREVLASG